MLRNNPSHYKGSCLCQKISYVLTQTAFDPLAHCHCSMCRKFHGAAFATLLTVDCKNIDFVSGSEYLKEFECERQGIKTKRTFCSECGSSLMFESKFNKENDTVELAIASLDDDIEVFIEGHIYTKDKANWHNISDSLPKYKSYKRSDLT